MELTNPGPAVFHVKPLAIAVSPLVARKAADDGRLTMITDANCRKTIRLIALELYQHEKRASIWHKNVCGTSAGNNLLYTFICSIHKHENGPGPSELANAVPSSPTRRSPTPSACRFADKLIKPCDLPQFDPQQEVNLAYFDCLFYVTVAKIRELHQELCDRLRHGLATPDAYLCQDEGCGHSFRWPCTVVQFIDRLAFLWTALINPAVLATLDTALRFRNLGHWSIILEDQAQAGTNNRDCRDRRDDLLKQKPGRATKNEKFLGCIGLLDVFEHSMSEAMICLIVKDIHANAMRDKENFLDFVTERINALRLEQASQPRATNEPEARLRERESRFHEALSSTRTIISDYAGSASQHGDTATSRWSQLHNTDRVDHKVPTTATCSALPGAYVKRHVRGQRELYPLDLYTKDQKPRPLTTRTSRSSEDHTELRRPQDSGHFDRGEPGSGGRTPTFGDLRQSSMATRTSGENHQPQRYISLSERTSEMHPPPTDGTWSFGKDQLYALLPEVPAFDASKGDPAARRKSGGRKISAGFFGLAKGNKK